MPQKWRPTSGLAKIVHAAGFEYDPTQDIIYSQMNPWQRSFGYAYPYDVAAPLTISAVIDCEPFFFRYKNKDWMIELWKGQYGLETGAEIGVYICDHPLLNPILGARPHDPKNGKFFDCVSNKQLLKMSFSLYRDGELLFRRGPKKHWWLTGFKWGVLSRPEQLVMHANITFPTQKMRRAFVGAMRQSGYTNLHVNDRSVRFVFDTPTTFQPRKDPEAKTLIDEVMANDAEIVKRYCALDLPNNDPNKIPVEAETDIADYFRTYRPSSFLKRFAKVQPPTGQSGPVVKALKTLQRRTKKSTSTVKRNVRKFFKELFG